MPARPGPGGRLGAGRGRPEEAAASEVTGGGGGGAGQHAGGLGSWAGGRAPHRQPPCGSMACGGKQRRLGDSGLGPGRLARLPGTHARPETPAHTHPPGRARHGELGRAGRAALSPRPAGSCGEGAAAKRLQARLAGLGTRRPHLQVNAGTPSWLPQAPGAPRRPPASPGPPRRSARAARPEPGASRQAGTITPPPNRMRRGSPTAARRPRGTPGESAIVVSQRPNRPGLSPSGASGKLAEPRPVSARRGGPKTRSLRRAAWALLLSAARSSGPSAAAAPHHPPFCVPGPPDTARPVRGEIRDNLRRRPPHSDNKAIKMFSTW
ncbi:translation initiation factor IF-2-like [Choloepus didactylus]|uniref:translation initiation factor IF-2-like n=1 Tax=Choloepus didactylus TaxID=27675 RepID=UPI00189E85B5|nr:translation initiation factor IF-2-like [Choloepus didactylus]